MVKTFQVVGAQKCSLLVFLSNLCLDCSNISWLAGSAYSSNHRTSPDSKILAVDHSFGACLELSTPILVGLVGLLIELFHFGNETQGFDFRVPTVPQQKASYSGWHSSGDTAEGLTDSNCELFCSWVIHEFVFTAAAMFD